jgi:hypothetical protein
VKENLEQKIDKNKNHILMGKALADSLRSSIEQVQKEVEKKKEAKPIEEKLKKILKNVKVKKEVTSESEDDILEVSKDHIKISYGRKKELEGISYADSAPVSYSDVMYGNDKSHFSSEEEGFYESKAKQEMELAETMNDDEAEITVKDVQYATVMGQQVDVDINARKRFSTWLTAGQNNHMLAYFEIVHGITRDVDYNVRN